MAAVISLNKVDVFPTLSAGDANKVNTRVSFGGNVTSSIKDPCLDKFRKTTLDDGQAKKLNDWNYRLNKSYTAIELHLEKRLSQLVVQAVTCYGTGLDFSEGHTLHQGLNAETILSPKGDIKFNAAHHATLPCLYASKPGEDKTVYLYRSGIYDESQATIDVVKEINDADRVIDEKYRAKGADKTTYQKMLPSQLRSRTVDLLNRSSKKELTPHQVAKKFATSLRKEIAKGYEHETNRKVKDVLEIYLKKAVELENYTADEDNFDLWLNLQLDDPQFGNIARIVEKLEDQQAVSSEKIQALIKRKIDALPVVIRHEHHQKKNESHAPVHFIDMYHFQVLERLKGKDREVVEEALGFDYATLKADVDEFGRVGRTKTLLAQHADKIDELVGELKPFIKKARGRETNINQFVGLKEEKKKCLRADVYRLRYEMIKADQCAQSTIKSKIEHVLNKLKTGRVPHFDIFFYRALLDHASTDAERRMFCKLLNISDLELAQKSREIRTNSKAHAAIEQNASRISKLSKRIMLAAGDERGADNEQALQQSLRKLNEDLRSVNHSDATSILFYKRLFDQVTDKRAVHLLEKISKQNEGYLDVRIRDLQRNKSTAAEKVLAENSRKIAKISKVAISEVGKLNRMSTTFRQKLIWELRFSNGIKQVQFAATYKRNFPDYPMSGPTLSRLENGLRPLTPEVVKHFSSIYGVHESLFYPGHFAEE